MKVRRSFRPGNFTLQIKRSRTGRGLFAGEHIARGACVIEYIGRPATPTQMRENTGKYLFWTSDTTMIDGYIAENRARFINHSCAPNCEVDLRGKRIYIFAKRVIKAGEELTYDYGEEYFDDHFRDSGCLCLNCSKTIA